MLWSIIVDVLVGALVGWLAGLIMGSNGSWLRNIIVGIVGSGIGILLGKVLPIGPNGWLGGLIFSVAGACLLIWVCRKIFK